MSCVQRGGHLVSDNDNQALRLITRYTQRRERGLMVPCRVGRHPVAPFLHVPFALALPNRLVPLLHSKVTCSFLVMHRV